MLLLGMRLRNVVYARPIVVLSERDERWDDVFKLGQHTGRLLGGRREASCSALENDNAFLSPSHAWYGMKAQASRRIVPQDLVGTFRLNSRHQSRDWRGLPKLLLLALIIVFIGCHAVRPYEAVCAHPEILAKAIPGLSQTELEAMVGVPAKHEFTVKHASDTVPCAR